MKKLIMLFLLIGTLFGCSNKNTNNFNIELDQVSEIKLTGKKELNFNSSEDIHKIINSINNSTKIEGVLDVREHDFVLEIIFKDNTSKKILLWISETDELGLLMNLGNGSEGHTISKDDSKNLRELIYNK